MKYEKLEKKFLMIIRFLQGVHPGELKNGVAEYLNSLLQPIREDFKSEEMQNILLNAYPPPVPVQQKKSKEKKIKFHF